MAEKLNTHLFGRLMMKLAALDFDNTRAGSPEHQLWAAVLKQAVWDNEWDFFSTDWCREIVENLGVDYKGFKSAIKKHREYYETRNYRGPNRRFI